MTRLRLQSSRTALAALVAITLAVASACGSNDTATTPIPAPTDAPQISQALRSFYEQSLTWVDCGGPQCTHVKVPLDYTHPEGQTLSLSVTRLPATGGRALGSLFVNPGGPGGSAFDYAKSSPMSLSPEITENYDIVGVDPRGVAKSDPITCLTDGQRDAVAAVDFTDQTLEGKTALIAAAELPGDSCSRKADPEFRFMSTADVARDMDVVRQLVGDASFNYLGKSYGTAIGVQYAQLFPQRVGRMVLDGILPTQLGLEEITATQAQGFEESFMDFAADCAMQDDCPFAGSAAEVASKLRTFISSLNEHPLTVRDRELNGSLATMAVVSFLYFPAQDYPRLRSAFNAAVNDGDGSPLMALLDERTGRSLDGGYKDNSSDAFTAVTCLDRQYGATIDHVAELAKQWQEKFQTFGAGLAWGLAPCVNWPAKGEAPHPVNTGQTAPILIVSNLHDPATPYAWGERLSEEIKNSALLTWDAYNHTAYRQGSDCIDEAVNEYLLKGNMPTANALCGGQKQ